MENRVPEPKDIPELNKEGFNKFATLLGLEFLTLEKDRCECAIDIRDDLFHPGGVVHGGVAFALADSSMAMAVISGLETGQNASTIELKISYLAPVREGRMHCESVVVRRGRRIVFLESKVHLGEKLIATATGTFAIITIN